MKEYLSKCFTSGIALMALTLAPIVCKAQRSVPTGSLRVGAAKVDITPPLLPMENGMPETLGSHLYVRAIVLDNGVTRAALINDDQGSLPGAVWSAAAPRIAAQLHCPVANIIMSAIHTHSDGGNFSRGFAFLGPSGPKPPAAEFPSIPDAMVKAVREADAHLQPAKVGYATQNVYLNVNRDAVSPITHRWYQGPNTQAPSDKTLAVVTFETPAGKPIAIYYNYAMHPIDYYLSGIVSADFPGTASRDLESMFPGAVAVFTQGASGNQNPFYLEPFLDMHEALDGQPMNNMTMAQHEAESNKNPAMSPWVPSREPEIKKAAANLNAWVQAEGEVISQAALRAIRHTHDFSSNVNIEAAQTTVTCPGRKRTNTGRQGYPGTYVNAAPIPIRLGLLRVGPIALGTVNAEVYNQIALRLKAESPLEDTMMVTLANGHAPSGYIYDNSSYAHTTFQVLGSTLKPGCAENAIVGGILGLMSGPSAK